MLKVRFFVNEPGGKPWGHFAEMIPRLGEKYKVEIETISKPRQEYRTEEYARLGLPTAPAIMVGDELVVQGCDVDQEKVEAAICRHMGLPEQEQQRKGILGRLLDRWGFVGPCSFYRPKERVIPPGRAWSMSMGDLLESTANRKRALIKAAVLAIFIIARVVIVRFTFDEGMWPEECRVGSRWPALSWEATGRLLFERELMGKGELRITLK
jgi:hypothetical protein